MGWRDKYKVHPAADVFPMMPDEELDALAEDIKANGQTIPVLFWNGDGKGSILIDGRNRLEACERIDVSPLIETFTCKDPVTHIITLNIRRRHLTQKERADLIVKAIKAGEKPTQGESVSKGGRGKKNPIKKAALDAGQKHGISRGTMGRALRKAEGRTPKPKAKAKPEPGKPTPGQGALHNLDAARGHYLECVKFAKDLDGELDIIRFAFREISGERAMASQKRAATLPPDGRSEVAVEIAPQKK
jgi:hypothetical protein